MWLVRYSLRSVEKSSSHLERFKKRKGWGGVIHMESDGAFAKNSPFFKGQTAASRFISATALLFARKDSIILRNDSRG